nr:ABC transporter substrate-binding protein [Bradyrhizobium sp. dw_411]
MSTGVVIILALLGAGIGLFPPRVPANRSPRPGTDVSGHTADITRRPRSVAVLAPVLSPYAAVAGGTDTVRAVSNIVRRNEDSGAFHFVFPRLAELPLLSLGGAAPDPELVLRLEPDAVLAWRVQSDALDATGYAGLVQFELKGKEGSAERIWELIGKFLGDEPRATRLWRNAQSQQQALRARLPHAKPIRVLIISPNDSASTWIGRKDYFLSPLLQGLGAENLTGDLGASGPVGLEQILFYEPDIILVPSFVDDGDISDIYSNPVWQSLRAVREKRVYLMPHTSMFNLPVDGTALSFWLAEILHPVVPHMARDVYRTVYSNTYGRSLSDDEIDAVLHLKKNAHSFGYARFGASQ